ncbi:MAG: hypothetical protein JWQ96_1418 [Segetibacter sp.]|jgi:hypothetical protein|nr:hypothetical protein [Segetibacter sp.]
MKRLAVLLTTLISLAFLAPGCETLQNLPTNTSGVFSLNGNWQLASTNDNNAMVGTTITVYPVVGNGTVQKLANNTYCIPEKDQLWRSIKSNGAGAFTVTTLVNACNGTTVYKEGLINVVNNNEVTVSTRTAGNTELIQRWTRVSK